MTTRHESLPVELTDSELRSKGGELAAKLREYSAVEEEKKAATKRYSDRLKSIRTEMDELELQINSRTEYRDVEVVDQHNHEQGVVLTVRTDTGDVVRTRAMTVDERQANLFPIQGGKRNGKKKGGDTKKDRPSD